MINSETGTKDKILRTALDCFGKYGYGAITITMIAKKSGLSKQRILYHYKTTEELLIELIKQYGELGREVTMEHLASIMTTSPIEKIIGISDSMFIWAKKYPKYAKLTPAIFQAMLSSPKLKELHEKTLATGLNRIYSLIQLCPEFKILSEQQQWEVAKGIHCLMLGAILYILGTNDLNNLDLFKLTTSKAIKAILKS